MYPFDEYRPSHRNSLTHYRRAQGLGLLPIAVALILLVARGAEAGPGIWSALGAGIALEMIMWSALEEFQNPRGRATWAERWMQRAPAWIPYLLVLGQGCFTAITLCLLWFSFCDLGFPASAFQHVLFLSLLLVIPGRRLLHVDDAAARFRSYAVLDQFLFYLMIVLVTLLITTSIQLLIIPADNPYITEVPLPALMVWVPALLICVGALVLFIDFVIRKK